MERAAAMIAEVPKKERPRERLLEHGGRSLSDAELVAVLLRTGYPGVSVLSVARELLDDCGGLAGLIGVDKLQIVRAGVGEAKAAMLMAAVEMGRRLAQQAVPERRPMSRPAEVVSYLALRYARRDQEVMGALYLDSRHKMVGDREIFLGTISRAAVEPREILKEALLRRAAGIVLFHTHPSGDPSPSLEDLSFTRRMAEAGEVLGVRLVDHLIVGGAGRWVSLKQRGAW